MNKYRKGQVLGQGSFGRAIKVRNIHDNKDYVMKEIDVSRMPRAERDAAQLEAKVLLSLKHPNIVSCTESFIHNGKLCIVMDYCENGDLYQALKKRRGQLLPESQILDWFVQICLAVKHVHDRKILHRDLKTQNIFVAGSGILKLGDFGVAKVLTHTDALAATAVGTPYYLSPEICRNQRYSSKSDIWSLGCVLYEMTTMKHAFDANSLQLLIQKIVKGQFPPPPAQYSKALCNLINKMIRTDPKKRPNINEVLAEPILKSRIEAFLSATLIDREFSHTVIHGKPGPGQLVATLTGPDSPKPSSRPSASGSEASAQCPSSRGVTPSATPISSSRPVTPGRTPSAPQNGTPPRVHGIVVAGQPQGRLPTPPRGVVVGSQVQRGATPPRVPSARARPAYDPAREAQRAIEDKVRRERELEEKRARMREEEERARKAAMEQQRRREEEAARQRELHEAQAEKAREVERMRQKRADEMARLQAEQRQLLLEKKQYDEKRRRMVEEERRRIEQAERVRKEREEEERHKAEIKAQKEAKRRLEEERKREWEERRRAAARNKQAQEQDMWGAVLVPGGGVAQPRSTSPISARSRTPDRRERMTPERDRAARNQLAMHAHLQAREEALRNKQRHMEELYGRRDGPQWNPSMQEDSTRTVPQSQQSTVSVISQEERARLFREQREQAMRNRARAREDEDRVKRMLREGRSRSPSPAPPVARPGPPSGLVRPPSPQAAFSSRNARSQGTCPPEIAPLLKRDGRTWEGLVPMERRQYRIEADRIKREEELRAFQNANKEHMRAEAERNRMRILGSQPQGRAPQAFQVPVGSQPHSPEPEVEKANLGGGAVPTLDPQGIQPPANPGQGGISEDDANEFAAMVNFMQQVYSNPDGVPDMLLHEDDSEYSDDNRGGSPLSGAAELHRIEEQANEGESLAAKVEALRVFLEDTLGVDRFYSAYRVLEDQGRSATSEEETLVEVQSILGPGNMFYLQHIYQLLQVEEALNQHSIA